jgi:predicted RNA-binding Zn-ribbon protein involved in translation (DUF1610 family)
MINLFKKFWRRLKGIPPERSQEDLKQLSIMFGSWNSPTGMRLILEQQAVGLFACPKCNGFGTYGMPLCGALYRCDKCNGTGKR